METHDSWIEIIVQRLWIQFMLILRRRNTRNTSTTLWLQSHGGLPVQIFTTWADREGDLHLTDTTHKKFNDKKHFKTKTKRRRKRKVTKEILNKCGHSCFWFRRYRATVGWIKLLWLWFRSRKEDNEEEKEKDLDLENFERWDTCSSCWHWSSDLERGHQKILLCF